jgi:hypothetical protein
VLVEAAEALAGDPDALDVRARDGREVDVVDRREGPSSQMPLSRREADHAGAVLDGGVEGVGEDGRARAHELGQRDGGRPWSAASIAPPSGAGIHRVLARVVAAVDADEDEVGAGRPRGRRGGPARTQSAGEPSAAKRRSPKLHDHRGCV